MPPDEPKLAQVIPLPVRRRPGVRKVEARLRHARALARNAPMRKRGKGRLMVVGALLVGGLWMGLSMAIDSIDEEGGQLAEESSGDWSPFQPSSEPAEQQRESDDAAGSAWFTTSGGGQGRR